MLRRHLFVLMLCLGAAPPLRASEVPGGAPDAKVLIERARAAGLDRHPLWLRLVHYARDAGGTMKSRADSDQFFLAREGKTDPAAELAATVAALLAPVGAVPDEHAACRFPARAEWLAETLRIDAAQKPTPRCEKFDRWLAEIAPRSVTLVFAANYFNNPSSMFGHTLIRIDRAPPSGTLAPASPLASYAVNFTAHAAADNPFVFTYKSFIGLYPGFFSLLPYHAKVREYSDFESRDLWEYELELDPAAVDRMVRHAWELDLVRFDYFFLDENCASQLLALIEVARPDLALLSESRWLVIPSDTVRTLRTNGLIRSARYRASRQTRIRHGLAQVGEPARDLAFRLATDFRDDPLPGIAALPAVEQAGTVDVAYEYLQYHYTTHAQARQPAAERGLALLRERNRISAASTAPAGTGPAEPPAPPRPDLGHATASVGIAGGRSRNQGGESDPYVDLRLRYGYHDFLDPLAGFAAGAKINFFDLTLRQLPSASRVQVQDLRLLDVHTIAPRDRFFAERSWAASFGLTRDVPHPQQRATPDAGGTLAFDLRGGMGLAFALGRAGSVFAQPEARLLVADEFDHSVALGGGARAGVQLDLSDGIRAIATSQTMRYRNLAGWSRRHEFDLAWSPGPRFSARLGITAERGDTAHRLETRLGFLTYF
jgi:hypothetical protein